MDKLVIKDIRPTWDKYFLNITELVATRSTCIKHKSGAILVKDKRILTTGYNGAPRGIKNCLELGCLRDELNIPDGVKLEICRGIHSSQNAIIQGALFGISTESSTLYTDSIPCIICVKILISAGIKKIVLKEKIAEPKNLSQKLTMDILNKSGIEISILKGE